VTEREIEKQGSEKSELRGEQKCRTATTTTGVIARERHGPRENASGPPNNSPRTTCTCHGVATRPSILPLLERRELASLCLFFFHPEKNKTILRMSKRGGDPVRRTGKSLERFRIVNPGDLNGGEIRWIARMRASFTYFKRISREYLSGLDETESAERLF